MTDRELIEAERIEFERWAMNNGLPFVRRFDGYMYPDTHAAWHAWLERATRAAASLAQAPAAGGKDVG